MVQAMIRITPPRISWQAIGLLTLVLLPAGLVRAATVLWHDPTIIAADTDVSTEGTPLYAYNFGSDSTTAPVLGDVVVNGVNFERFAVPGSTSAPVTVGSVSLAVIGGGFFSTNELLGSNSAPFSSLIPAYQELLRSGVLIQPPFTGTLTLTLGDLTAGQSYQVQCWTNYSGVPLSSASGTTYTAGNSVTLINNSTGASGGIGQWVTGSFTADASTQVITLQSSTPGSDFPVLNALQVRVVPEPSSAILLLSASLLCLRRRADHKA